MVTDLIKTEYPFNGNFLNINGIRLHYLDEGKGNPVIMLHGNPSWSFYFRNLVLALRGSSRCIVPDHIGCGFSDKPDDSQYDYTLPRRVDDLEKLLDRLDIYENITLVLHDWGGMIGMTYAHRHPERISRIVLLNTAAFHLPAAKKFPLALRICRDSSIGSLLVRGFNLFSVAASYVGCKKNPMKPEMRKLYQHPYDSWKNRIATLRFVQDIPLTETDRNYALISEVEKSLNKFNEMPVLICWGELDFVFDQHFLAEWKRRFSNAEIHNFPDCGHYILEDAGEYIIPLIKNFLTDRFTNEES